MTTTGKAMKRLAILVVSILALAACEPEVPDSAAGVGFGNYNTYQQDQAQIRAQREAQLSDATTLRPPEVTGAPDASGVSASDLAAAGIGATAPPPAGNGLITPAPGKPLAVTATGAAYAGGANVAASGGQTYAAVSPGVNQVQQPSAYQASGAQSVPSRPSTTGPDIVAYALATTNPVGTQAYTRTLPSQSKAQRKCARYASPDVAQRAFLSAGGPEKDRHGIDPDGDGFACAWNPDPFRRAVGR